MRLALQVVVGDLLAIATSRQIEGDDAVEATGPQDRGVEAVGAVRGGDQEHIGLTHRRTPHPALGREPTIDPLDERAGNALATRRHLERLHLDE